MEDISKEIGKGSIDKPEDFLKPKAWRHEEISAAFRPAQWVEKDPRGGFTTYPKRNQGLQSTCTAYALAKQLSVDELSENKVWRELSPRSIYPYVAVPGGGSSSILASKLAVKQGMTLEFLLNTDGLPENEVVKDDGYTADAKVIALVYKPQSFVECETTFDTIASVIQEFKSQGQKKVVTVTVAGQNNGTWGGMFPKPPVGTDGIWYHRVTVTDFGLIDGVPHLAIDNSWGEDVGYKGQQYLSKDWAPHMFGAIYTINLADDHLSAGAPVVTKPTYEWTKDLELGSSGKDVEMLQVALQSIGMFPASSVIKPTGYYGGITKKAVELFQSSFAIAPATGNVGPKTRAVLNGIFKA